MKFRKTGALLALTLGVTTIGGQLAAAAPVDDKRAQAQKLQAQIDANGMKMGALAEKANGARYRLAQTTKALADAESSLAAAEANARNLRTALSGRAAELLKANAAGQSLNNDEIDLTQLENAAQRAKYAELSGNRDREALNKLAYVQEDLTQKRSTLNTIKAQRKSESDAISKAESDLKKANAENERALKSVNSEIRQLVEQQQAQSRAAATRAPGRSADFGTGPSITEIKAPNATARAAIAFAQAQLGKPYVYGASGPGSYDCSGLTMSAYAAAGVGMPHYSGAQFSSFPRVSLDALSPGDLVFWGPGGSNHVGLYIGGGTMIHAPHTGDVVRYAPIYGSPSGAVRPWA
ncbi:MAG: NlpC/P60 family protein [Gammaproteobacteria bacterium]